LLESQGILFHQVSGNPDKGLNEYHSKVKIPYFAFCPTFNGKISDIRLKHRFSVRCRKISTASFVHSGGVIVLGGFEDYYHEINAGKSRSFLFELTVDV
jgi:hypothetical protein